MLSSNGAATAMEGDGVEKPYSSPGGCRSSQSDAGPEPEVAVRGARDEIWLAAACRARDECYSRQGPISWGNG